MLEPTSRVLPPCSPMFCGHQEVLPSPQLPPEAPRLLPGERWGEGTSCQLIPGGRPAETRREQGSVYCPLKGGCLPLKPSSVSTPASGRSRPKTDLPRLHPQQLHHTLWGPLLTGSTWGQVPCTMSAHFIDEETGQAAQHQLRMGRPWVSPQASWIPQTVDCRKR